MCNTKQKNRVKNINCCFDNVPNVCLNIAKKCSEAFPPDVSVYLQGAAYFGSRCLFPPQFIMSWAKISPCQNTNSFLADHHYVTVIEDTVTKHWGKGGYSHNTVGYGRIQSQHSGVRDDTVPTQWGKG